MAKTVLYQWTPESWIDGKQNYGQMYQSYTRDGVAIQIDRQADKHKDRWTDKQMYRKKDRWTEEQADK